MGHEPPDRETVTIGRQGRLVIPARMREALSLKPGQQVTLTISDGELHLSTVRSSVERARRLLGTTEPRDPALPSAAEQIRADRDADLALEDRTA